MDMLTDEQLLTMIDNMIADDIGFDIADHISILSRGQTFEVDIVTGEIRVDG